MDWDGAMRLPMDEEARNRLVEMKRVICGTECYASVPRIGPQQLEHCRVAEGGFYKMLEVGQVELLPTDQGAEQTLRMFGVLEVAKKRWRMIKHTANINDADLPVFPVKFPTSQELDDGASKGPMVACIDFAAYYDQIGLSPPTRNLHCFRGPDGAVYRLTRLPMGQRQAVAVACALTAAVLSFDHQSCVQTCIDNIRFVGKREDVLADLTETVRRCRMVGLTINEVAKDCPLEEVSQLISSKSTFMGRLYDHREKTVCLAEKTVSKLRLVLDYMRTHRASWRNVAALLGLLFFAQHVLQLPISQFGNAFRMYREVSRQLANDECSWDQEAVMQRCQWDELQGWASMAITNRPRSLEDKIYTDVICTDASKYGWGFCHLNIATGGVNINQGEWPVEFEYAGVSTRAESQAIYKAIHMCIPASEKRTVLLLTDAEVSANCINKRYAKAWYINWILYCLVSRFPYLEIRAQHIPGETNIADGVSRGESIQSLDTGEVGKWLRRYLGPKGLAVEHDGHVRL
jgi:hypothetical protein